MARGSKTRARVCESKEPTAADTRPPALSVCVVLCARFAQLARGRALGDAHALGAALDARRRGFARDLGRGLLDCGRGAAADAAAVAATAPAGCSAASAAARSASSTSAARRRAIASSRLSFHLRSPIRMYSGLMSSMSQTLSNEKTQRLSSCAIHSSASRNSRWPLLVDASMHFMKHSIASSSTLRMSRFSPSSRCFLRIASKY